MHFFFGGGSTNFSERVRIEDNTPNPLQLLNFFLQISIVYFTLTKHTMVSTEFGHESPGGLEFLRSPCANKFVAN